ncbi:uncharacterized protein LOC120172767 [Hibiscus syriacus]|uniref:uncharacterized protein LOC120172767 n=1 Tax=Hibiscus syriacus TaxID=106335 RepID=UPI001921BC12|nr:uncharacterized protein LOC120172767 [Hibiscus syriacus]
MTERGSSTESLDGNCQDKTKNISSADICMEEPELRKSTYEKVDEIIKKLGFHEGKKSYADMVTVRFGNEEDYTRVPTEGPWTIFGIYLTIQPWSRSFTTTEKHPSHVVVWFRLPGLPYRYYTKTLFKIAALIGKVVKIDYNTSKGERGRFVRLAIVIDLNKPLLPCIGIDGFIQNTEYEGLQQICFQCGVYGHSKENCRITRENEDSTRQEGIPRTNQPTDNRMVKDKQDTFGPWMVLKPRRRRPRKEDKPNKKKNDETKTNSGSRFRLLQQEEFAATTIEEVQVPIKDQITSAKVNKVTRQQEGTSRDTFRIKSKNDKKQWKAKPITT